MWPDTPAPAYAVQLQMAYSWGISPQPALASNIGTATVLLGRRGRKTRIRACLTYTTMTLTKTSRKCWAHSNMLASINSSSRERIQSSTGFLVVLSTYFYYMRIACVHPAPYISSLYYTLSQKKLSLLCLNINVSWFYLDKFATQFLKQRESTSLIGRHEQYKKALWLGLRVKSMDVAR
jgi:hypothetical protein